MFLRMQEHQILHHIFMKCYLKTISDRKCAFFVSMFILNRNFPTYCSNCSFLDTVMLRSLCSVPREVKGVFHLTLSFFFGNYDLSLAFLIPSIVSVSVIL